MERGAPSPQSTAAIRRGYVTADDRLVHYRVCGSGPAVVLLHDSPRSSRLHEPLMAKLADRFQVFALDTPGYGNSDPLGRTDATIPDFAAALGAALRALGLAQAPVYATHTSAKIALALAVRGGTMPLLVLDGLSIPEAPAADGFIAAYMRPFTPEPTGGWLAAEWSRTRDMLRWFPWFTTTSAQRIAMAPPAPEWVEDYGIDLFCAGPAYADAYTAAMRWTPHADLLAVRVPTVVGARRDDVLYPHLDRVPCADNAALAVTRLDDDRSAWAEWIAETLGRAAGAVAPAPLLSGGAARGYTLLDHGQLHWTRHAAPGRAPSVLILSAPSTLEAHAWGTAIARHRPVIVPDLPGFGDSAPLPGADPDALADALAALIGRIEPDACDVLAIGLAAPLGARLAARRPGLVRSLTVWGCPGFEGPSAETLCPPVAFDALAGSHLHRLWHMLRDSAVQWPWLDAAPEAARAAAALPDAAALHRALTGLLKQRTAYGQAVAASLRGHQPATWRAVRMPTWVARGGDPAMATADPLLALLPRGRGLDAPAELETAAAMLAAAWEDLDP